MPVISPKRPFPLDPRITANRTEVKIRRLHRFRFWGWGSLFGAKKNQATSNFHEPTTRSENQLVLTGFFKNLRIVIQKR